MSSETDTDGGYVHTPGDDGGGEHVADPAGPDAETAGSSPGDAETRTADPEADGFGRKGWALTGVLFVCVLVIPGIIYVYPYAPSVFGFSFFATYLALPFVPAVLLGLVAVWSMTAATADR